jgi:hypothetical protein
VSLTFENCLIGSGNRMGAVVGAVRDDGPAGAVIFRDCVIRNPRQAGAYVYDKSASGAEVRFENCQWSGAWSEPPSNYKGTMAPLRVYLRRPSITEKQGGIHFEGCYVHMEADAPVLAIEEQESDFGAANISGTVYVRAPRVPEVHAGPDPDAVHVQIVPVGPAE